MNIIGHEGGSERLIVTAHRGPKRFLYIALKLGGRYRRLVLVAN